MVTLISFFSEIITLMLIFNENWITAGILVLLFISLDNSDGEVARYNIKFNKEKSGKKYGEFLDDMLGVIIFYFIILAVGYHTSFIAGIAASYSMILLNFSAGLSTALFRKNKIQKITQDKLLKRIKISLNGKIGFTAEVQRILIAAALIFSTALFLWIYFFGAMILIAIKFIVYRNE
jgi:phosphatidylglycerophosphate synthase